jgi:hypothetical protein
MSDARLEPTKMPLKLIRRTSSDVRRATPLGWPAGLALLVAMAALLLFWSWSRGSDARSLARMPAVERARLFQLTRDKAQVLCADRNLEDRCREEVDLLSKFPECDAEWLRFVARTHPPASR